MKKRKKKSAYKIPRKKKKSYLIIKTIIFSLATLFFLKLLLAQPIFQKLSSSAKKITPSTLSKINITSIPTPTPSEVKVKLPIFMYHYVEYVKDQNDFIRIKLNINPLTFENQVITLKENGYTTILIKDIADILNRKKAIANKIIALTFDDGYRDFYTDVYPILQKYNVKATVYVIVDFIGRNNFMTKEQISELSKSGLVEIGAHTLRHLYLKSTSEQIAREEIFDSKKALEAIINAPVYDFSYPYGAYNFYTKELVREAGYLTAVTVTPGTQISEANRFVLPRLRPGGRTGNNLINWLESFH